MKCRLWLTSESIPVACSSYGTASIVVSPLFAVTHIACVMHIEYLT